jgi:hypothetical protein
MTADREAGAKSIAGIKGELLELVRVLDSKGSDATLGFRSCGYSQEDYAKRYRTRTIPCQRFQRGPQQVAPHDSGLMRALVIKCISSEAHGRK